MTPKKRHRHPKFQKRNTQKKKAISKELEEFQSLVAVHPSLRIPLSLPKGSPITIRLLDLFCPIGFGQRALILAPPKTGKTTFIKDICLGIQQCSPSTTVFGLLIDERPEEVTDFRRGLEAEIFASSNDDSPDHHLQTAHNCLEKAVGLVLHGQDVVIVLDSLTRLTRSYNVRSSSHKIMSGGLSSDAFTVPKRIFGAARQLDDGASLTVIATCLVDTGSRMDDVISQEFKGTGNMELLLDRKLAESRIFPAINIPSSGTRNEANLLSKDELRLATHLRRTLADIRGEDGPQKIVEMFEQIPTNQELLATIFQES